MSGASHRHRPFFVMLALASLLPLPVWATDSAYTPPMLFGTSIETQVLDVIPVPTAPPSMAESKPAFTEKMDLHESLPLEEAASASERVTTPVQTRAPMTVNVLLDHPADRITENAKPLVTFAPPSSVGTSNKATESPIKSGGIPDLLSYDDPTGSTSTPVKKKKSSPTLSPVIEKIIEEKPQVVVYSRDKKTGEFFKVTQKNDTTSGHKTFYRARTISNDPGAEAQKIRPMMPAQIPATVQSETLEALNDRGLPAISLSDLNKSDSVILNTPDTSAAAQPPALPLPIADQKVADTEPLAGNPEEPLHTAPHVLVVFAPEQIDMNNEQKGRLQDNVLPVFQKTPGTMVEIQSFATPGEHPEGVTRLSLARGLSVRQFLKDNGVPTEQIKVRALTVGTDDPAGDRVDLLLK